MAKGGSKQTVTQTPDAASQGYINQLRALGQNGAGAAMTAGPFFTGPQMQSVGDQAAAFMNPYTQNVVGAVQGQYDQLRGQAATDANQQATQQGAFGGSRAALMQGARLGQLDQGQASTIAGLLQGGYQNALTMGTQYAEHQRQLQEQLMQEPLFRAQNALNFANLGLGPVGSTTIQQMPRNVLGGAAGGAMAGAGVGGPLGAAIGGGIGLLSGLFG